MSKLKGYICDLKDDPKDKLQIFIPVSEDQKQIEKELSHEDTDKFFNGLVNIQMKSQIFLISDQKLERIFLAIETQNKRIEEPSANHGCQKLISIGNLFFKSEHQNMT